MQRVCLVQILALSVTQSPHLNMGVYRMAKTCIASRDRKFYSCKFLKYKFAQISPQICSPRMVFFAKVCQSLCSHVGTSTSM